LDSVLSGTLRFLYVGSSTFDEDLRYYRDGLGASIVWNFKAGGARVAALRVATGPLLLLADHRPAPSCLPVFEVPDLRASVAALRRAGYRPASRRFEIPNGPCVLLRDPSENELALFEDERPNAMERAFANPENRHAVREASSARESRPRRQKP
jgi:hypothetical protein